jgi:carbon monoxide dehydrogenase subunit G
MIELERTISVDRPAAAVVEYLADFANAEEWDSGTKTCTRIDEGPIQIGSRWRNVSEFRGRETELQYTLIRHDPQRLTFTGENKTVTSTDDLTFEDEGNRTRIRYQARFKFKGLAALVAPFVRGSLDKLADDTIEQMKSVLDQH